VKVRMTTYDLNLEVPFAIARGTTSVRTICVAEIDCGGVRGYGEASPSRYYGDDPEKAADAILGSEAVIGDDPFAMEVIAGKLKQRFPASPSGRAAVEAALYDIMGKITGQPVYRLLGLAGGRLPVTSLTVGVEDVASAGRRIDFLKTFPVLKAKVGFGDERALLTLLKTETTAVLRVDANEGWSAEEAVEKINSYGSEFSIEYFEQPLPRGDLDGYRILREKTDATIIVDESVECKEDVLKWRGLADGVNIKLMKCGGIREAMRMVSVARAAGLSVMLGCMVESSLGITAAAHIASLVDYCDLDGNLLITNDPFCGVKALGGRLSLSNLPGLGANPAV
jgi:L-alanine-DL-glutamate epimerase-like enolase superfamily enzyme